MHTWASANGICCSWWDGKYWLQKKLPETPMQEHQFFCIGRLYIFDKIFNFNRVEFEAVSIL